MLLPRALSCGDVLQLVCLLQECKRRSRDMETETEEELLLFPPLGAASSRSGSLSSSVSLSDKSVSTDNNVEEFFGDAPFAGLFKGSTAQNADAGTRSSPAERPKTLRRLRNVYEPAAGAGGGEDGRGAGAGPGGGGGGPPDRSGSLSILSPFDEQEEWNKISEIMASFGTGLARESALASELEKELQSRLGLRASDGTAVGRWLAGLHLAEYEGLLRTSGYDDLDFINGVLEDSDLRELGISSERDRSAILEAARALPAAVRAAAPPPAPAVNGGGVADADPEDHCGDGDPAAGSEVDAWLRSLRLGCYCDTFRRHLYTDMARVRRIWEVELTAVLEISRPGHRRRILASVGAAPAPPGLDDLTADLNQLKCNIQQLKEEIREKLPPGTGAGNTGTLRHSHKKSRPAPPPPPANGELPLRGPGELLQGVPATLTTQWRHAPHALVTASVSYVASYLGSTVVKELRGTESTKKSIQKLKKSPRDGASTPDIALAISYRGVKFLNTLTQELVCEHEIRNIHCACQDADDLTHFAYITQDRASSSHYCHVFCVNTMDQATEIILTLGQAFEVAYQLALRDPAPAPPAGNGHSRSQSACHAPAVAPAHARSLSVNEIKLNGLAAREPPGPAAEPEPGKEPGPAAEAAGGDAPLAAGEEL